MINKYLYTPVRSMSDAQESGQLLSGSDLPNTILDSLLNGAQLSQGTIGLVNLSPYDGCVEAAAARYHMREGCEAFHLRSLSIGFDMEPLVYSEKILGVSFLQDSIGIGFSRIQLSQSVVSTYITKLYNYYIVSCIIENN